MTQVLRMDARDRVNAMGMARALVEAKVDPADEAAVMDFMQREGFGESVSEDVLDRVVEDARTLYAAREPGRGGIAALVACASIFVAACALLFPAGPASAAEAFPPATDAPWRFGSFLASVELGTLTHLLALSLGATLGVLVASLCRSAARADAISSSASTNPVDVTGA